MKKFISILMVMLMMVSLWTGCAAAETIHPASAETLPAIRSLSPSSAGTDQEANADSNATDSTGPVVSKPVFYYNGHEYSPSDSVSPGDQVTMQLSVSDKASDVQSLIVDLYPCLSSYYMELSSENGDIEWITDSSTGKVTGATAVITVDEWMDGEAFTDMDVIATDTQSNESVYSFHKDEGYFGVGDARYLNIYDIAVEANEVLKQGDTVSVSCRFVTNQELGCIQFRLYCADNQINGVGTMWVDGDSDPNVSYDADTGVFQATFTPNVSRMFNTTYDLLAFHINDINQDSLASW